MSEQAKKALMPVLRFPEFLDAGEWINSTLGDISKITSGGTPSRSKNEYWNGNIPWVTTSLIDFNIIQSASEFISELGLKESSAKIFPKNTILIAMYGHGITRGKIAVLEIDAATNQACAAILLKKEINTIFVFQNLASRYDEIRDLSNQGGQENLSGGLIEKIPFSFPASDDEQQKIADCLSSIDELVTVQTQKIDVLKAHKKSLMQQLFPAEGETKPKLRFKEFSDEWTTHQIGDFIESYKGGAALTPSDFVPYSACEVIPKKAISHSAWLRTDIEKPIYCNEEFFKKNIQSVVDSTYLITTLRDLVPSGPSIGYIVKYAGNKKYILAQGVYGLKPKESIIADFLIYFSNTDRYRKLMNTVMVGSTQVHIRNNVYLSLPISVPSLEEQQKIADCLTSLDDLITAQSQKLAALKTHKKGLMQQLFPAVDEVAG